MSRTDSDDVEIRISFMERQKSRQVKNVLTKFLKWSRRMSCTAAFNPTLKMKTWLKIKRLEYLAGTGASQWFFYVQQTTKIIKQSKVTIFHISREKDRFVGCIFVGLNILLLVVDRVSLLTLRKEQRRTRGLSGYWQGPCLFWIGSAQHNNSLVFLILVWTLVMCDSKAFFFKCT